MQDLEHLQDVIKRRRAVRRFRPDPLPNGMLDKLLECAHWAPSGYNLQPTHFVVVSDPDTRNRLHHAAMGQNQILQAPATVVFTADRHVASNHLEIVIQTERKSGAINDDYEQILRKYVSLAFGTGPLGLGRLGKAALAPLLGLLKPTPSIPAVHKRYWLAKQAMLTAMNFMLAATGAGLATCPMEGFDERRVRRLLSIPKSHIIPLLIPVGYASDTNTTKTRLPLNRVVHHEKW